MTMYADQVFGRTSEPKEKAGDNLEKEEMTEVKGNVQDVLGEAQGNLGEVKPETEKSKKGS